MTTIIIEPYPNKFFPWQAIAKAKHYSSVFETKDGAKAAMVSRFGKCKFVEKVEKQLIREDMLYCTIQHH